MEGTIGEIRLFAGNFAPRQWAYCAGQLMAINSNTALFSIIGTTYGGDGRTTFGLPDLRGRVAVSPGLHPGSNINYQRGQYGGEEQHVLNLTEIPSHNHPAQINNLQASSKLKVSSGTADEPTPEETIIAEGATNQFTENAPNAEMSSAAIETTVTASGITVGYSGSSQAHNNIQPFAVVNYIICLQGVYPSRS